MDVENTYNLIDEPWIPVLMQDGATRTVSLSEIFSDNDGAIADLALNPYERVAVSRLLLCISQAALEPARLIDESAWLEAKSAVCPMALAYLRKWHGRFFLYGPHAFLQPDCIALAKADSATPLDKLVLQFSSGNNSTLYDHGAALACRDLSFSELILGFLVFQNFSSGGTSGQCIWDGVETKKLIVGGPCRERSMLFSILLGDNLIETIWLNLLTDQWARRSLKANWGRPFWEFDELSRKMTADNEKTILGHLAPFSRAIKLTKGATTCILGEALSYPQIPEWREPMASVKLQNEAKKSEFAETYVSSNPAMMPWRELPSLLAVHETDGRKAALALRHLQSLPYEKEFTLWTGGLFSKQAKDIATVEWKARLSVGLLEDISLKRYQNAIEWAERQLTALHSATEEYARIMKVDVDKTSRFFVPAERVFWDMLSQPSNQKLVRDVDSPTYLQDWRKVSREAAEEAYQRACVAGDARQMEAYVQGFSKLRIKED